MDADSPHPRFRQRRLRHFDYASREHIYFVTIRAKDGTVPFADPRLANEVITSLRWLRTHRGLVLYAYCLMPDHLHLLLQLGTTGQSLGTTIGAFKRYTTRQSWPLGTAGALWQPRFYDHIVRNSESGLRIAAYILANPVRKRLVEREDEYRWSGTLDSLTG